MDISEEGCCVSCWCPTSKETKKCSQEASEVTPRTLFPVATLGLRHLRALVAGHRSAVLSRNLNISHHFISIRDIYRGHIIAKWPTLLHCSLGTASHLGRVRSKHLLLGTAWHTVLGTAKQVSLGTERHSWVMTIMMIVMIMIYLCGDGPGGGGALLDWDINTNLNTSCDSSLAYKV